VWHGHVICTAVDCIDPKIGWLSFIKVLGWDILGIYIQKEYVINVAVSVDYFWKIRN